MSQKIFEDKFRKFLSHIKKTGLAKDNFNEILVWGEMYGRFLCTNHIGIYRDDDFENNLIQKYIDENDVDPSVDSCDKELHIASNYYSYGGHTRLMERMINLRGASDLLVSRSLDYQKEALKVPKGTTIFFKKEGYDIATLVNIISKYKIIYLHISQDDLSIAVAVGIVKRFYNIKIIFVNHADHCFSFGFYSADIVAEVSSYGYFLSQNKRNVHSSFLGIPLNLDQMKPIDFDGLRKNEDIQIFSAGSGSKYKPHEKQSFPILTQKILNEIPNARITIIGPKISTDWWWWKTKLSNFSRLNILPSVPYDIYISYFNQADIYLDSFPMTGGTALPEIRSKNIPVTGLLSGSFGYTPLDATKFYDMDELVLGIKEYAITKTGQILFKNNDPEILSSTFHVHSYDKIKERLDEVILSQYSPPPNNSLLQFDFDFYKKQWIARGVIGLDLGVIKFFVKKWAAGGREAILLSISRRELSNLLQKISIRIIKLIFKTQ